MSQPMAFAKSLLASYSMCNKKILLALCAKRPCLHDIASCKMKFVVVSFDKSTLKYESGRDSRGRDFFVVLAMCAEGKCLMKRKLFCNFWSAKSLKDIKLLKA